MSNLDIEVVAPEEATRPQTEAIIAAWRAKRAERLEADKVAEELRKQETAFKQWLIQVFLKQQYEGIVLGGRVTGAAKKIVPTVEDRAQFSQYILDTGALDLLQFRISTSAIAERESEGVAIPGLGHMEVFDLYDRKA